MRYEGTTSGQTDIQTYRHTYRHTDIHTYRQTDGTKLLYRCLRKILRIHWPETISNTELWEQTNQIQVKDEITQRKWRWIGHTLRKPVDCITRQALTWNPQGSRKRGRPRNTWRRDLDKERASMGVTWGGIVQDC